MGKEEGNWKPSHWKPGKLARYLLHVKKQSMWAACQILGPHDGMVIAAMIQAQYNEQKSVAMLRQRGVRLIGDKC